MTQIGMKWLDFNHAAFYSTDPFVILFIHVDDMTLVTITLAIMIMIKKKIRDIIEVVNQGEIHWLLGIEIRRSLSTRSIQLSQHSYIDAILSRYGFSDIKPLSIPFDPHTHLTKDQMPTTVEDIAYMRDKPYREALGALQYLSVATRPDITYAVSILARFSHNPGITHWNALKRVYAYLKSTRDLWLTFGGEQLMLEGFSDADGMSQEDRHAISGYVFMLNGGAVSWSSKRQGTISLSTTEAEYIALTHAAKEVIWFRNLLSELFGSITHLIPIHSDNQSAIALAKYD